MARNTFRKYYSYTQSTVIFIAFMITATQALYTKTVEEYSKTALPCDSIVPKDVISVQWFKSTNDDHFVDGSSAIATNHRGDVHPGHGFDLMDDYSLVIFNVTKEREGIYRCDARGFENPADSVIYDVKLQVFAAIKALDNMIVAEHSSTELPRNYIIQRDVISVEWYEIKIDEWYENAPGAIVTYQSGHVYPDPGFSLTVDFSLVIFNVTKEREGIYRRITKRNEAPTLPELYDVHLEVIDAFPDLETTTDASKPTENDDKQHTVPSSEFPIKGCMQGKYDTAVITLGILLLLVLLLWISSFSLTVWKYETVRKDITFMFKKRGNTPPKGEGNGGSVEIDGYPMYNI